MLVIVKNNETLKMPCSYWRTTLWKHVEGGGRTPLVINFGAI